MPYPCIQNLPAHCLFSRLQWSSDHSTTQGLRDVCALVSQPESLLHTHIPGAYTVPDRACCLSEILMVRSWSFNFSISCFRWRATAPPTKAPTSRMNSVMPTMSTPNGVAHSLPAPCTSTRQKTNQGTMGQCLKHVCLDPLPSDCMCLTAVIEPDVSCVLSMAHYKLASHTTLRLLSNPHLAVTYDIPAPEIGSTYSSVDSHPNV